MHTHGIQINGTDEPACKAEVKTETYRTNIRIPWGEWRGRLNWEIKAVIYTLLCVKQVTNENLHYSTGNSTQCPVVTSVGKGSK